MARMVRNGRRVLLQAHTSYPLSRHARTAAEVEQHKMLFYRSATAAAPTPLLSGELGHTTQGCVCQRFATLGDKLVRNLAERSRQTHSLGTAGALVSESASHWMTCHEDAASRVVGAVVSGWADPIRPASAAPTSGAY